MTIEETDVVIVGAGSVGSMAAWQLTSRGVNVIALDRFSIPGSFSSYSGESRLFRKLYAEGGHYTPLLERSQLLWRELEELSGNDLLHMTGALSIVGQGHPFLKELEDAGTAAGIKYEVMNSDEARRRFAGHHILDGDTAFFDPEGGYVKSERAVIAALLAAAKNGATFPGNRKATSVETHGDKYLVHTDNGPILASKVIVSAGTGAGPIGRALGTHLSIRPQVLTWFPMKKPGAYSGDNASVFIRRSDDAMFYGFPSADGWTVKVAGSVYLDEVETMETPLSWDPMHLETIRGWARTYLPDLHPEPIRTAVCADAYAVDHTALLGPVPGMPGVISAVGFSGHGFKMASAFGAVAAELAIDGTTTTDVSFMSASRFLPADTELTTLELV